MPIKIFAKINLLGDPSLLLLLRLLFARQDISRGIIDLRLETTGGILDRYF
jgi:hypothetical protein